MLVWRLFKKKPKFYHKHLFEHFHIWRSFLILLTEEVLSYHLSWGSSIISHKKVLSYHSTVRVHKSCCSFFFTCTAQNKVVAMLVFVLVVQYCLLACIIWPAAFTQILGATYKCRFVFLFQLLNHILQSKRHLILARMSDWRPVGFANLCRIYGKTNALPSCQVK